jgi:type II secretory pathway pseudopilin PulG
MTKKNLKSKQKHSSFTLMEMLVYLGVLAIVFLIISSFLLWAVRSNKKAMAMRETLENANRAMEIMIYEIREAKSIYTPTSVFSTSSSQLSLETEKYLPDGETTSFIDFYLCGDRLCLKRENSDPIALTSENVEVKNLEFNLIATTSTFPSIKINLKVDYKNPKNRPELSASVTLNSTISLRSY